jgi:hypothetical protein
VSLTGIDHVVILFPALDEAIRNYTRLGFTVVPGGAHPGGTHNALIALADGAYLELIAFTAPNPEHRWWAPARAGGGLVDFCLATTDLAADLAAFRRAGARMADPIPGARRRPDGFQVAWRVAVPEGTDRFQVPFLIEDVTPRRERVPGSTRHANGVTGIESLSIAVLDLQPARSLWSTICEEAGRPAGSLSADAALGICHRIGPHALQFVSLAASTGPLADWLATHGPSPFALTLGASAGASGALDERAARARIELRPAGVGPSG